MKIAHCKYNFANQEITVDVYFEPKAFCLTLPPLTDDKENDFIRKICDSMANAMPKDNMEKRFYVKRAFEEPELNQMRLLCTDGFLVDAMLILTISQQPFAQERTTITTVEQVPIKFRLSSDILKILNDRLAWFEDEVKKTEKFKGAEAIPQVEKPLPTARSYLAAKTADVFSEIAVIKKEINEMARSREETLKDLMEKISGARNRIFNDVMKEATLNLKNLDNKDKYETAVNTIINRFSGELDEKTLFAKKKINEIEPISSDFENEIKDIYQQINNHLERIIKFREITITCLYDAAKEYAKEISKEMQSGTPNASKILMNEFNRKFQDIATINERGELSDVQEAYNNLNNLTLEDMQNVISNEDKTKLGLLQKCNTSWTEESKELKIVLKHLEKLNAAYRDFLRDDPLDPSIAKGDLTEITRIPFPRSYQFKFTPQAFELKKIAENFGKAKKDTIVNMAKEYKKKLQLDDVFDKTKRAMLEIDRVGQVIKDSLFTYKDFLNTQETADTLVASAGKHYQFLEESLETAKSLQSFVETKVSDDLRRLKKKINTYTDEIQTKVDKAKINLGHMQKIVDEATLVAKSQTQDEVIKKFWEVDNKLGQLKENHDEIAAIKETIEKLNQKCSLYHQTMTAGVYDFDLVRKQQAEAKNITAQLIKDQAISSSQERRKAIVELYTKIETGILEIDKVNQEIESLKKQLLLDMNKKELPDAIFEDRMQILQDKFNEIAAIQNQIGERLGELKTY